MNSDWGRRAKTMAAGLVLAWLAAAPLSAAEIRIAPNVVVVPDPAAATTTVWMIVRAGCRDEPEGHCHGLAHYLEHLMFLGRGPEHKAVAMLFFPDAQANGYTNWVSTVFWQRFPRRAEGSEADVEKLLSFYARELSELNVSPEEAERERNVVLQEQAMRYSRSAEWRFQDRLRRQLYPRHPLGEDVLGSREDIAALTLEEARAFHDAWYLGNNVSYVIYGPVEPAAMKALADKYLSASSPRAPPDRDWLNARLDFSPNDKSVDIVDAQAGARRFALVELARVAETDPQRFRQALGVLGEFLRSTLAGGMRDALVDKADYAKALDYIGLSRPAPGVIEFSLWLQPEAAAKLDGLAPALNARFAALAGGEFGEKTLLRFKARIDQRWSEEEATPSELAEALVQWLAEHLSFDEWFTRRAALAAVTVDDVKSLAEALAHADRVVSGSLSPTQ
jgi:zinc protease